MMIMTTMIMITMMIITTIVTTITNQENINRNEIFENISRSYSDDVNVWCSAGTGYRACPCRSKISSSSLPPYQAPSLASSPLIKKALPINREGFFYV
jgi:hypothetical protein